MSLAADQKPKAVGLSPTSVRMMELRGTVFALWEKNVRAALEKAAPLSHPILTDTLPPFYDNIAEAITPSYPRTLAGDGTTLAAEHGGERARVTAYDHESLISEYQMLRGAIFEVVHQEGLELTHGERMTINASIDQGIQQAVAAFSLVHSALRERFAAALTHDLRNPLGAAMSAIELALLVDEPTKSREAAGKALENINRMDVMIHELLDTMSFHSGEQLTLHLVNFDACALVQEVQDALSDAANFVDKGIEEPVRGWWDRAALHRALENIVKNAVKYGDHNFPITVSVNAVHGRLLLSVHNEGPPIPVEEQESVFQMYRRTRRATATRQHGWGIGLPYVRAVAESHGGSIALDSTAERGTTFIIDIPLDCRPLLGAPRVA